MCSCQVSTTTLAVSMSVRVRGAFRVPSRRKTTEIYVYFQRLLQRQALLRDVIQPVNRERKTPKVIVILKIAGAAVERTAPSRKRGT